MKSIENGRSKRKARNLLMVLAVEFVIIAVICTFTFDAFAAENFYELTVGGKSVAALKTEAGADQAIKEVEGAYVKKGASDVSVKLDPVVQVKKVYYGRMDKKPEADSAEAAADTLLGKNNKNEQPVVDVTTSQTVAKKKAVAYKTVVKESAEAALNTTGVKQAGQKGSQKVLLQTTSVNGEQVASKVVKKTMVKAPKTEVKVKGTKVAEGAKGTTNTKLGTAYSRSAGEQVAKFALKWVGNPYVWGGESLTNGADCSGFVLAVYKHFGIQLPHDAGADRAYGVEVALKDAQPGDLICYYGHIGIYIGNNQLVHAMNEANGITVSKIGYNGKQILTVRRLLG